MLLRVNRWQKGGPRSGRVRGLWFVHHHFAGRLCGAAYRFLPLSSARLGRRVDARCGGLRPVARSAERRIPGSCRVYLLRWWRSLSAFWCCTSSNTASAYIAVRRRMTPISSEAPTVGLLAASGLVAHSVMDGFAIGAAFQAGIGVGAVVAVAVIGHDFADGFNTYTITSLYGNDRRRALTLLAADAIAPVAGAALTLAVTIPHRLLDVYLGFFAGFLMYLASADVLPRAHTGRRTPGDLGVHHRRGAVHVHDRRAGKLGQLGFQSSNDPMALDRR